MNFDIEKITKRDLLNILSKGVNEWNAFRRSLPIGKKPWLEGLRLGEELKPGVPDPTELGFVNFSDTFLAQSHFLEVDLSHADLSHAILESSYLSKCYLVGTICHNANFRGANLYKSSALSCDLRNADLRETKLESVDFGEANLEGANLSRSFLYKTDFLKANLKGADLRGAVMLETDFTEANMEGANVYGISCWDVILDDTNQKDLRLSRDGHSIITVDNLEMAQFLYLLMQNRKIRDVIDAITAKVILILGRFTQERKPYLDFIRDHLREMGMLPVLFDFEGPESRDITETVSTLAHMSKVVIADITDAKSIPQELQAIVPNLPSVTVQPLLQDGTNLYGMFEHFLKYPWVRQVETYRSTSDIFRILNELKEHTT